MTTVRDLRKRIGAAQNIQQITKTMEMVAAARLRRAQTKAEQARPYALKMKEMLENLSWTEGTHPLFNARPVKKIGAVVISSDRGLCGAYNMSILAAAENFIQTHSEAPIELIPIGRKAVDYYHRHRAVIPIEIPKWDGNLPLAEIQALAKQLIDGYLSEQWDQIWLIYTHFINALQRQIMVEKLLPIDKTTHTGFPPDYIFEPEPARIYQELLPRYCAVRIQTALNESYAAELAARVFAMRTATKNAGEMIDSLTLLRNKVRQAGITKEMLEIISGAEGLK
jgi:F-type H+-transporting ATPase subunit gamma